MSAIKSFFITFSIAVLLFAAAALFIVPYATDTILPLNNGNGTGITPPTDENSETSDDFSEEIEVVEGVDFTVLLIGTDYAPDVLNDYDLSAINETLTGFPLKERTVNADSIVLLHFSPKTKKLMITAIPSNMIINISGINMRLHELYDKKNFATFGIDYLRNTVTSVTGLQIDYYASISLSGFATIIESLGGVTFDVPVDMVYDDETQSLHIDIKKGEQRLNGEQVTQMIRYCTYADGNNSRMSLTINFAKAFLKRMASPENLVQAPSLYKDFKTYVTTNFTEEDLMRNLTTIFALPKYDIIDISYPGQLRQPADSEEYFEPDISSAISLYKEFKT